MILGFSLWWGGFKVGTWWQRGVGKGSCSCHGDWEADHKGRLPVRETRPSNAGHSEPCPPAGPCLLTARLADGSTSKSPVPSGRVNQLPLQACINPVKLTVKINWYILCSIADGTKTQKYTVKNRIHLNFLHPELSSLSPFRNHRNRLSPMPL